MEDFSLWSSLAFAGLIIGLLISIAAGATIHGLCSYFGADLADRATGLLMVMVYLPLFLFLMRKMTEVTPMIIGIMISSAAISITILIQNFRATKNPQTLPKVGS
jgi:hypothetical protein